MISTHALMGGDDDCGTFRRHGACPCESALIGSLLHQASLANVYSSHG